MAYASSPDQSYPGTAGATPSLSPSGPHGFYRRQGQPGRGPGRPKAEKCDDVKDMLPNPSESTTEQADETRATEKSDCILNRSDECTSQTDVLYRIDCYDKQQKRRKNFATGENPFEEMDLLDLEKSQTPMIIEIFINAIGAGSPGDWDLRYAINTGRDNRKFSKHQSPLIPSPLPRGHKYADFNSDASDDYDEESLEEDRLENSDRSRTFRVVDERSLQTLKEVLNKGIFRASLVTWTQINIHSRNLLKLLRSVVKHYPGQSLKGEKIIVKFPFEMLAHYYNDLNALQNGTLDVLANVNLDGSDGAEQLELTNKADLLDQATLYDLKVLLRAFKGHYVKNFAPEEARYNFGVTSYELIWFLFRPGVDVYARIGGKIAGFVFERGERRERGTRRDDDYLRADERPGVNIFWVAHCWSLTYDGRRIVKTSHEFIIDKFRGERQITSLPVFPSIYLDNSDGGKTRARLQDLGEKYYGILRRSPAHMEYCGMTWDLESDDLRRETAQEWRNRKPDIVYIAFIIRRLS